MIGRFGVGHADVAYETSIEGVADDNSALKADLEATSQLVQLQDKKADTDAALARRAETDTGRLTTVLNAYGFWDAAVTYEIDDKADPRKVHVKVETGQPYLLNEVKLAAPDGGPVILSSLLAPDKLGLKLGEPARSAPVVEAEPKIFRILADHAHPLAKVLSHRAVIDKGTRTMSVTYTVDAGPEAVFGASSISGLDRVDETFVRERLGWTEGAPYKLASVDDTRQKLIDTNLFSIVNIQPTPPVRPDEQLPLTLALTERPPRTVSAGLNYDTTEGVGANVDWEHRNLFGRGEDLDLAGQLGSSLSFAAARYKIPGWLRLDQDLLFEVRGQYEEQDAYKGLRYTATGTLERRITSDITGGAGLRYERGNTTDLPEEVHRKYQLVGIPVYLRQNAVDDLLNPTRGYKLGVSATPYLEGLGSTFNLINARLSGSIYERLGEGDSYVFAAYAAIGTDAGVQLNELPKDKRLYAGGGGSVRAYGYQKAGPLDRYGNPIGGRSSLEAGIELRIKVTDTIGVVPFVDAGRSIRRRSRRSIGRSSGVPGWDFVITRRSAPCAWMWPPLSASAAATVGAALCQPGQAF